MAILMTPYEGALYAVIQEEEQQTAMFFNFDKLIDKS